MSSDQMEYTVRIYLTNGERLCYKSKVASEDVFNLGGGIENALKADYIGLDMNGKLTIIPFQKIQKIEIEPAPQVMIAHVARNIEAVDE